MKKTPTAEALCNFLRSNPNDKFTIDAILKYKDLHKAGALKVLGSMVANGYVKKDGKTFQINKGVQIEWDE